MPAVRERLREIEATLQGDATQGRLVLGALLGDRRLRVYADGRFEGSATLSPELLAAPRQSRGRRDSVV